MMMTKIRYPYSSLAPRSVANGTQVLTAKPSGGDAFQDALYGSESELEGSDDDEQAGRTGAPSKQKGSKIEARLRLDDDEPMDLLQGAASRLTGTTVSKICLLSKS